MSTNHNTFHGAKLVLLIGGRLLVIRRDLTPGIAFPGHLDLPGGGREGQESARDCVLRETQEEVGLSLPAKGLSQEVWVSRAKGYSVFFSAALPESAARQIVFGDEGQSWCLMSPLAYLHHPLNVPHFADQVRGLLQL